MRACLSAYHDQILRTRPQPDIETICNRHRDLVERLLAVLVSGCAHGADEHHAIWIRSIERLAQQRSSVSQRSELRGAGRLHPVAILFYGSALAAMARKHDKLFVALLRGLNVCDQGERSPLLLAFEWGEMDEWLRRAGKYANQISPYSDHLFDVVREPLRGFLPGDAAFEDCFDRFEYLRTLVFADLYNRKVRRMTDWFAPRVRLVWKRDMNGTTPIMRAMEEEAARAGDDWPYFRLGLFDGSHKRFVEVCTGVRGIFAKFPI